ncbi:unnamed protein product, partial [Ectocarpus sp. 12 AP-2014]
TKKCRLCNLSAYLVVSALLLHRDKLFLLFVPFSVNHSSQQQSIRNYTKLSLSRYEPHQFLTFFTRICLSLLPSCWHLISPSLTSHGPFNDVPLQVFHILATQPTGGRGGGVTLVPVKPSPAIWHGRITLPTES